MGADTARGGLAAKKLVLRSLFLAMILTALPFIYVTYYPGGTSSGTVEESAGGATGWRPPAIKYAGSGTLRSRYHFNSYDEYVQLQVKKTTDLKLRKLWTTRDWRRKVDIFSATFQHLLKKELLKPGAKALCIGARVGQEVLALRENGIVDAIGIDLVASDPLVIKGDMHRHPFANSTFDFEFSNVFDHALFPELFIAEIERTLKPGGVAALHLCLKSRTDKYSANDLFSLDPVIALLRESEVVDVRKIDALGLDTELVIRKRKEDKQKKKKNERCERGKVSREVIEEAEELIAEEPLKPWITLKRNLRNMQYLPNLVNISNHKEYVYVDVGARNYGSSIGSWFKKQYPTKGNHFRIFAFEADSTFYKDYNKRKDTTLLPYAAWTKNETLWFGGGEGNEGDGGGDGEAVMGRILLDDEKKIMMGKKKNGDGEGEGEGEVVMGRIFDDEMKKKMNGEGEGDGVGEVVILDDEKKKVNGEGEGEGEGEVMGGIFDDEKKTKMRKKKKVEGIDLGEWMKGVVTSASSSYVVMKMDVEGSEFGIVKSMMESGAMCLVDELFLECHYNRWQKCCPGVRSPKYGNVTYSQCLSLFHTLRSFGILVHQWW